VELDNELIMHQEGFDVDGIVVRTMVTNAERARMRYAENDQAFLDLMTERFRSGLELLLAKGIGEVHLS
jgi:hypothetical protein